MKSENGKISLIIPVLNEESFIKNQADFFISLSNAGHEVIIVDAYSSDDSIEIAKNSGCKIISTQPSRGGQLKQGAELAVHDILLFLHADTFLPKNVVEIIDTYLNNNPSHWGRFAIEFDSDKFIYKVISWCMNKRTCITGIVTGDHAMFMTKEMYFECGGFSSIPLMEDIDISIRLKKFAKPICMKEKVISSSRKWECEGITKVIFKMWMFRFCYFIGVTPEWLAKYY